ncbi:MAG: hypothetical protein HY910_08700 [Desulfarculus sp.]|nr:hypothetical protein [Desulfarculus sp.]
MRYLTKHLCLSTIVAAAPTFAFAIYFEPRDKLLVDLLINHCSTQVTFGLTLGGFFLAAASILAGFSATEYLGRLTKAKKTWNTLLSIIFIASSTNIIFGLLGYISYWVLNAQALSTQSVAYIAQINIFLLAYSAYFSGLCLVLLKEVLANISS